MLNGLYGFIFGTEESADSAQKENVAVLAVESALVATTSPKDAERGLQKEDDDWIFVQEHASGRSSPVMVPNPELEEIDALSTTSSTTTLHSLTSSNALSPDELRHAGAVRQAKSIIAQRNHLEKKLFEDPLTLRPTNKIDDLKPKITQNLTASNLKRSTAAGHVASEAKTKQRSKKAGKLFAGRNNDRKVNNLN